jgi:hypothetical protein
MRKTLIIGLVFVFFLSSCKRDPKEIMKTDNKNFEVQLLFEIDGCKVYRFFDGDFKYFTTCNGSVSSKTTEKHARNFEIQTVVK